MRHLIEHGNILDRIAAQVKRREPRQAGERLDIADFVAAEIQRGQALQRLQNVYFGDLIILQLEIL